MRRTIFSIVLMLAATAGFAQKSERTERLEKHLYFLASDSLHGREAGSEDNNLVRAYILEQWNEIGLEPLFFEGFEMPFSRSGRDMANLVGVIQGNDPVLSNEYIVVGAHFDHIGFKRGQVCNGADDNASGSSALIEVARMLKENQKELKRSVIIAAFDGEEQGLWGSEELASRLNADDFKVQCMMSLDMVGWYAKNGKLELLGAGTFTNGKQMLNDNAGGLKLKIGDFETAVLTATDTRSFAKEYEIPTLHVYTGLKSPYHKPEDDADLIDYEGLDSISCFIARVAAQMASDPEFGPTGKIAQIHSGKISTLEFAVGGGFNTSSISFPDARLTAAGKYGWTAGFSFQYNHKSLGLKTGATYEAVNAAFPDQTNVFGTPLNYSQSSVRVPLTLLVQTSDPSVRLYLGVGADMNYLIETKDASLGYKTNGLQWGTHFMFGFKMGHVFVEDYFFSPITEMFDGTASSPKAKLSVTTCKIGWIF